MSLITQIAALATRVAAEIKLLRTEIPPDLPTYTPAGGTTPILTTDGSVVSWTTTPAFTYLETTYDLLVGGMTVGLGGGASSTNMALGTAALEANATGFGLCAVGAFALSGNITGKYNCAIGYSALSVSDGSDNTVVGTLAGNSLTGGNSNTFIGRSSGQSINTGSSNTIIGRASGTSSMSSTIILAAGTNERARCDSSANWGFGTTAPTAKMDINGDSMRLRTASTPASATAAGDAGTIKWDADHIYVCVATDTWKRAALSTW